MRRLVPFFGLLTLLLSADIASAQPACRGATQPAQVAELLFGRSIGGRFGVTEAKWARFLADEVTPRFPDGLTVTDARGQWRENNRVIKERSKVLMIALPGHATDDERLAQVIAAYKTRFNQRSVGLIVRQACVSF